MRISCFGHYATCSWATATMLAECRRSEPPIGVPGAMAVA